MDWLRGMNEVIAYIEGNLTQQIKYDALSRIVGCSVYEFSRIFSFMAGISVSEYIRRRRLSQAAFDIQNGKEKIIEIALKYGYESPTTFTRAFKELHGVAPSAARKESIPLKTYPPITFLLTIKGVNAMEFRIVKREGFRIVGLSGYEDLDYKPGSSSAMDGKQGAGKERMPGDTLSPLWREFMDDFNSRLVYSAPFWQVAAYQFQSEGAKTKTIIGAEYKGQSFGDMKVEEVPAATWAVFSITSPTGVDYVPEAYTRIMTEWFPLSQYRRDEAVPNLEVFPPGDASSADYRWEIWMPVKEK